jgi:hypothetical protein
MDEARDLARDVAASFAELVRSYREDCKLSAQEPFRRADQSSAAGLDHARRCPPDELTWFSLDLIARGDPAEALRRWGEVKEAARGELRCGQRAARAVEFGSVTCWGRAQFLAVRAGGGLAWR